MLMFGIGCGLLLADLVAITVGAVHNARSPALIDSITVIGMLAIPFLAYPSLIALMDLTKLKL